MLEISLKYCGLNMMFCCKLPTTIYLISFFEFETLDIKMEKRVVIKLWFSFTLYRFLVLAEIFHRNIDIHLNAILFYYMYLSSDNRGLMA